MAALSFPFSLTSEAQEFIERNGQHYESTYGIPHIGGRIIGLLLLSPQALTIDIIGSALHVSHGSVSTNLRLLVLLGLVEKVTFPGKRRDFYQFSPYAWEAVSQKRLESLRGLEGLAEKALKTIPLEGVVRRRLEELTAWTRLAQSKYSELALAWRLHHEENE